MPLIKQKSGSQFELIILLTNHKIRPFQCDLMDWSLRLRIQSASIDAQKKTNK